MINHLNHSSCDIFPFGTTPYQGHQDVLNFSHDDVIKWEHFPRYWPFERGIHWSPVDSPHIGQWRRALMLSLICAWTSGWVNNRDAGNSRRHRAHYDVTVMTSDIFLPVRWPSKFWRLLSLLLIDDPASFPPTVFRHKSKNDQSWCCYSLRRNTDRITTIFCKYNDSTHWYGREYKQTPCNRMWNFMEMSSVSNVPWITNKNVPILQWRHNGRNSVSNHHSHDCLLNGLFRRRSKKT